MEPEEDMFANAGPVESVRSIGHMQVRPMAPARRIATSGASNLPQTMVIVMHRAGAATNLTHDASWLGHETVSSRGFPNQLRLGLLLTGFALFS